MAKLNIGVAGLGRIGWQFHCTKLSEHKNFNLVATCDPVKERGQEATQVFGTKSYQDYKAFLNHPGLDVVVVASPTQFHKLHAISAMKNKKHVVLEKPMAMNITEAKSIVSTAKKTERILSVYQPHRVTPTFVELSKLLKSKSLGKPYHFKSTSHRFVQRDDWQSMIKFGGGMLGNYGAHALDRLLAFTGCDVRNVYGHLSRVASVGDAEDVVKIVYDTKSGVIAEATINQASVVGQPDIEVWTTRGHIVLHGDVFTVTHIKGKLKKKVLNTDLASSGRAYPSDKINTIVKKVKINPNCGLDYYKNIYEAITKGKELIVKPEHTLAVMGVMDKVRMSAGKIVSQ